MSAQDRRTFIKSSVAASAAGFAGLSGCIGNIFGGDLPVVNQSYTVPGTNFPSLLEIPEFQDEMTHIGEDYELEISHIPSTPDVVTAMAAGEADIGLLANLSFQRAVSEGAVPGGMSAIAIDFYDSVDGYHSNGLYTLEETGIQETADLEGTTLTMNARGSYYEFLFTKGMVEAGLDPEEDVDWLEVPFPAIESALREGRADAGAFPVVFLVLAQMEGDIVEVFNSRELFGREYPFLIIAAPNDVIEEEPEMLEYWCADYVELLNYAVENRDEIVPIVADYFDLPEAVYDQFYLTEDDYWRPLDAHIDMEGFDFVTQELIDLGFIDDLDVTEHATNEFLPDF